MTPQQKLAAARKARSQKYNSRPRFDDGHGTLRGLLPEEIDAFYVGVRSAQDRRLQEIRQQMPRKRA